MGDAVRRTAVATTYHYIRTVIVDEVVLETGIYCARMGDAVRRTAAATTYHYCDC